MDSESHQAGKGTGSVGVARGLFTTRMCTDMTLERRFMEVEPFGEMRRTSGASVQTRTQLYFHAVVYRDTPLSNKGNYAPG